MTDQHPITPPPELLLDWDNLPLSTFEIFVIVAQWGADQELEATLAEVSFLNSRTLADRVRTARRPKPPSLKEQALEDLEEIDCCAVDQLSGYMIHGDLKRRVSNIRRALEALPND